MVLLVSALKYAGLIVTVAPSMMIVGWRARRRPAAGKGGSSPPSDGEESSGEEPEGIIEEELSFPVVPTFSSDLGMLEESLLCDELAPIGNPVGLEFDNEITGDPVGTPVE